MSSRFPIRAACAAALAVCLGGVAAGQCGEKLVGHTPGTPDDHFGQSFDVDGDRAVVAAPRDSDAGTWAGAAYAFERQGNTWVQVQKLVPTDLLPGALFSHAQIALDGEWLFAGSVWEPTPDQNGDRGVVRVYRHDGTGWQPFQKLWQPGTGASSSFAARIEADDGQCVVTARGLQKLFIYRFDGVAWTLGQELGDPDPWAAGDWLGVDVAMQAGRIATSSVREIDGDGVLGNSPGVLVAHLFKRGLVAADPQAYGYEVRVDFWSSAALVPGCIALGDDRLALQGIISPESQQADLHLLQLEDGLAQFTHLVPPDGIDVDFGRALAFEDDDLLLVGARGFSPLGPIGRAFTYRDTPLGWHVEGEFRPATIDADMRFATEVRADGQGHLLVATELRTNGQLSGRVQAWRAVEKPTLAVDVAEVSLAAGGTQKLSLATCDDFAGRTYVLLGALTLPPGNAGLVVDDLHLPLVIDAWFLTLLTLANGTTLQATIGLLDASGEAQATIVVPPQTDPSLAGAELFHAALVLDSPGSGLALATTVPTRLALIP